MKKSFILFFLFLSFRGNTQSCDDLIKNFLKASPKSVDFVQPSKELIRTIDRELRKSTRKLGVKAKDLRGLSISQKKQLLILTGVSVLALPKVSNAGEKIVVTQVPIDKDSLKILERFNEFDISIEELLKLPLSPREKKSILDKLRKAKILSEDKDNAFYKMQSLSKDEGKNVYNPTIWDFLSMDLSTPLFTLTKEVFNRAIAKTRFEQTIEIKIKALESSFKEHLGQWIEKLPAKLGEDRHLKSLVTRLYIANESCKAVNIIDLYKKVMADLDKLMKAAPDPKFFLEEYSKKSKAELYKSLKKSFINSKAFLKESLKKTAELVDESFSILSGRNVDCIPSVISTESVNSALKEAQKIKDGINSLGLVGSGKHGRDIRAELKNDDSCSKLAKDQIKGNMEKALKAALSSQLLAK